MHGGTILDPGWDPDGTSNWPKTGSVPIIRYVGEGGAVSRGHCIAPRLCRALPRQMPRAGPTPLPPFGPECLRCRLDPRMPGPAGLSRPTWLHARAAVVKLRDRARLAQERAAPPIPDGGDHDGRANRGSAWRARSIGRYRSARRSAWSRIPSEAASSWSATRPSLLRYRWASLMAAEELPTGMLRSVSG